MKIRQAKKIIKMANCPKALFLKEGYWWLRHFYWFLFYRNEYYVHNKGDHRICKAFRVRRRKISRGRRRHDNRGI